MTIENEGRRETKEAVLLKEIPLRYLMPKWVTISEDVTRSGMGLRFLCPKCRNHFIVVWFSNPTDGKGHPYDGGGDMAPTLWQRSGYTFENLSLQPSLRPPCGWHGVVIDGLAKTVS